MYDAIVLGVGSMGSAACLELARRGARVLGLEQFAIPHAFGSYHGHTRMFRMAYYEHPDYVLLLKRAYDLWKRLEREAGVHLFHVVGALYMGPEQGDLIRGSMESAGRHSLTHDRLDAAAVARRFPQFRPPAGYAALYEPHAGFVLSEQAVAAMTSEAIRHGAEIHGHEPVTAWQADSHAVSVRTARAEYRAHTLVVCGGAWTGRVARDLGVPLLVSRQVVGWVQPSRADIFALGRMPCWGLENPDGSLSYGFPIVPPQPGLKMAVHVRGVEADPDTIDRRPAPADDAEFRRALGALSPDAAGPTLSLGVCMYTNSADGHFIIDRHPCHPNVLLACGFSGHGFKFAPVVGEVLAELATRGETTWPVRFLSLARFRGA